MPRLSYQHPAIPVELLTETIKFLGEDYANIVPKGSQTPRTTIQDLNSCALACKLFSSLCRPYIFRRIVLGRPIEYTHMDEDDVLDSSAYSNQLLSLLSVLRQNRGLAGLVQELHICVSDFINTKTGRPFFNAGQLKGCKSILQSFPNLGTLEIYYPSSQWRRGGRKSSWTNLLTSLVRHYVANGSLKRLNLDSKWHPRNSSSRVISYKKLLSCSSLRFLELHNDILDYIDSETLPVVSSITDLKFSNMIFTFSLLKHFPNLESLSLHEVTSTLFTADDPDEVELAPCIRSLVLNQSKMQTLRCIYAVQSKKLGVPPFATVQSFTLIVKDPSKYCLKELRSILLDMPNLKSFNLAFMLNRLQYFEGVDPIAVCAETTQRIAETLRTCTTFSLSFTRIASLRIYKELLSSFSSLLHALRNHNEIQEIVLNLSTLDKDWKSETCIEEGRYNETKTMVSFVPDLYVPLTNASALLSCPEAFPELKQVKVNVDFLIDWFLICDRDMDIIEPLRVTLQDTLKGSPLVDILGNRFITRDDVRGSLSLDVNGEVGPWLLDGYMWRKTPL
ncbi:hypothetical protein CVT24_000117 [Panaeolus cyanescens]|uniref:F-box domain-containing protein n=1 Tax=Panaeolus cyanescens TaxID=181874 RepID=A0A409W7Q5_9AGAR|nr:hypothetical protein CVT24_000117 [Panaeolus cyanescens]